MASLSPICTTESTLPVISLASPSPLADAIARFENAELLELPAAAADEAYAKRVLVDTPQLMVVAVRWRAGARTELHGHSDSEGLYRIFRGQVEEERYLPEADALQFSSSILDTGDETYLPAGSFHQLRAIEDSITLHVYSPRPVDTLAGLSDAERTKVDQARRANERVAKGAIRRTGASRRDSSIEELAAEVASDWGMHEREAVERGSYRLPPRILEDMRSSGILSAPVPRHLGGLSATLFETATAVSLIAEQAPAAALAVVMPLGNAATCQIPLSAVQPHQVAALRVNQRWIADQVGRGRILAVANSEPGAGGSLANTKTVAHVGASSVSELTGRKTFATIGPDADYFLCAARCTETEDESGKARIDGFFVHRDAPGLTVDSSWNAFGMRTTASVGLTLENSPAEAILGYAGCLESVNARHWSTLLFSAVFIGIGRAALREGLKYGGSSPWARGKLAEHVLAINAAEGFLHSVCLAETWPMPARLLERVQQVKTFATKTAVEAATQSAMISGGRCYVANHPLYRLLSDSLAGPLLRPPLANAMDTLSERLETAF